jgi:ubiquinol-cytochrome c reductase cytochrome b subunit
MGLHQTELTGLAGWVDARMPTLRNEYRKHMADYFVAKSFNVWYFFGSLAIVVLVIQILTGIFLTMHYKPDANLAFASVEYIMREVPGGWFIRYMHSTGASAFFIVIYLHMFRGLLYGSYRTPREMVWLIGCAIFLVLMGEAFFGYLLPWGQMSYWGAQVIVNLFSAIPLIGNDLSLFIRGDYVVSDATLNRFFAFHVILFPLILLGLVVMHILALHDVGSLNPDGIEIKDKLDPATGKPLDGIPFHPYYTVHDGIGLAVFLLIFFGILFFAPEMGGYFLEWNNFIPADPLTTPVHIAPVWYFTPFYSILRATTEQFMLALAIGTALYTALVFLSARTARAKYVTLAVGLAAIALMVGGPLALEPKLWGVILMGGSVLIFMGMPWLDHSPVKSMRYRPRWHFGILLSFVAVFLVLGYFGTQAPSAAGQWFSMTGTLLYFAFFLLMPWWSRMGTFKPVPDRVPVTAH